MEDEGEQGEVTLPQQGDVEEAERVSPLSSAQRYGPWNYKRMPLRERWRWILRTHGLRLDLSGKDFYDELLLY